MASRRTVTEFEQAFEQEIERERNRRASLKAEVKQRSSQRYRAKAVKHQNLRFVGLVLAIVATAISVAVAMFETLSWVMS